MSKWTYLNVTDLNTHPNGGFDVLVARPYKSTGRLYVAAAYFGIVDGQPVYTDMTKQEIFNDIVAWMPFPPPPPPRLDK